MTEYFVHTPPFDGYFGGKNGDGVYQTLINHIPRHMNYVELFLGGGYTYLRKRPAFFSYLNDADPDVYAAWKKTGERQDRKLTNMDWLDFMTVCFYSVNTSGTFIFIDPPYPATVRRDERPRYGVEMLEEQQHEQLLKYFTQPRINARVMICGYDNDLYETYLSDWKKVTFTGRTRRGVREETIWMNYDLTTLPLHDYRYVGEGYRERWRITKKRRRWVENLRSMDPREREAIIYDLVTDPAALFPDVSAGSATNEPQPRLAAPHK